MIMDGAELEIYLLTMCQQILGRQISDPGDSLFTLGMNSLQAIQLRGSILRDLYLGGNSRKLSLNVVFEKGNIANLARHIEDLRASRDVIKKKPIAMMEDLILEFSAFNKHAPGASEGPKAYNIVSHGKFPRCLLRLTVCQVLTGATGSLGAHILNFLLSQTSISKIYCLIRGDDPLQRLQRSFQEKGLPPIKSFKLQTLASNLSDPHFDISPADYTFLASSTTHIIHCAWPVNIQLDLPALSLLFTGCRT